MYVQAAENMNCLNHRKRTNSHAFTLLELLVVISIMAVLTTVGVVSYTTAQKKARDANRRTALRDIQNAFEQYFSICGYKYGVTAAGDLTKNTSLICTDTVPATTLITYPGDPLGGNYQCVGSCTITSYTVCPPVVVVNGAVSSYLETENCTTANQSCCLKNQQ